DEVVRVDQDAALVLVDRYVHRLQGPHVTICRPRIDSGSACDLACGQPTRIALEERLDLEDAGAPIPFFERAHFLRVQSKTAARSEYTRANRYNGRCFALAYAIAPGTIRVVTGDLWLF